MASVDDLFKKPVLPSQKRKLEPIRDPNQSYKAPKLSENDHARARSQATVEEEGAEGADNDGDGDDLEAGPELPPDFEEDGAGDEEGRFFGSGMAESTAQAMSYLDTNDDDEVAEYQEEKIDVAWLRRTALAFEKAINRNAELRAKFEAEPQKFMASEADLDTAIKALSIISEHPRLYPEFASLGCTASLISLLAHDNTDIAIDAIEIVGELIDDDVEAREEQWSALVDAMLDADLLDLLYSNLGRLDEAQEADRAGVYNVLGVLESLSSRAAVADKVGQHKRYLPWLLERAARKEQSVSQNKQYAAELCAILLQTSAICRSRFVDLDGVDAFLQLLSAYRKRDPEKGTEEEEFMENLFDALTCVLDESSGKIKFLEAEGIELCLIMLREGKMSKVRALGLLDRALSGIDGVACCMQFVKAAGLKPLFAALMKKQEPQSVEHMLGMLSSMLRLLPADSAPRIRLLAKFVEKDYQKLSRLGELRDEYVSRLAKADEAIARERANFAADEQAEFEDLWLSRRLEAGLYGLQTADTVMAWLAAEDEGARGKAAEVLNAKGQKIEDLKQSLQDQALEAEPEVAEMLEALMNSL